MSSRSFLYLLTLFFFLSACQEGELFRVKEDKYPEVQEALWTYFENFERAGAERGLSIDLASTQISGIIKEIHEENVAGQCSYGYRNPGEIAIDLSFWNRAGTLTREMIVFHELGHCFLERAHTEETFPSGYCVSIMRSGMCCCQDAYTSNNREYYLDELFEVLLLQ